MPRLRRFVVPAAAVAVPAGVWALKSALNVTDTLPDLIGPLNLVFMLALTLAAVALVVWFFVGSGVRRPVRLGVGIGLLVGVGVAAASVRTVEFDGGMRPTPVFRWQPTADDRLAAYRGDAAPSADDDSAAGPADSPAFRGVRGDGHTPNVPAGARLRVKWRRPAGGGHGGIAVAGVNVVTVEQRGDDEAVVSYDRKTGAERWACRYPAHFRATEPLGGGGPRTTPAVGDGDVVSLGAVGDVVCVDAKTGTRKWHAHALADSGAAPPPWALSGSPLVVGARVVVNPGVDPANNTDRAVIAYDRKTGGRAWAAGGHPAAYASPALVTLAGVPQVVVFDADGLGGHDPDTGAELWRHPWKSYQGMNSAQPVAVGADGLFVSSEKGNGCALLTVSKTGAGWAVTEAWKSRALFARYSSPVLVGGHLYGLSDGRMTCVDAATGKRVWSDGGYGNGQTLTSGDRLFVTAEDGDVAVVAADPAGHRELFRLELFGARTWNMPALAGGELFVRNHREIACLEVGE